MAIPTQKARVTAVHELAPDVREIILAQTRKPIHFRPGQWISLHLPVGERPPLIRAYSLAEPESSSGELTICFDRVEGGLGSGYLNMVEPGQELVFAGPFGSFTAPDPLPERLVFVGRFTGIVPIRCMIHAICSSERELARAPDILLLNSADRPEHLLYHEEFATCALRSPRFRYIATVPSGGPGLDSRPETDILRDVLIGEGWGERLFVPMVSGVKALVHPVRDFFMEELGFERRDVRCESYD